MKHTGSARNHVNLFPVFLFFAVVLNIHAFDEAPARGDEAMARRYAQWAGNTMDQGLWKEALAGLERARDFADVSSDISYLLALARSHENKSRLSVLDALEMALVVDRWNLYESEDARLMKAENLIAMRAYSQALMELSMVRDSPAKAELTLKTFMRYNPDEFRRYMSETLDRYPREVVPVHIFLDFLKNENAAGRNPELQQFIFNGGDMELLELIIRRLPVLLLKDPELAWMAAPFIRDRDEAKRMVMAYRAINKPMPASLPVALYLGVIDDETALEELFASTKDGGLDMALLSEIWTLLRRSETRELFRGNLSGYTGVIKEDTDKDGVFESFAEYRRGMTVLYTYDADQDGIPELTVYFEAGIPARAQVYVPPDTNRGAGLPPEQGRAALQWERFPAVLDVELDGVRYIPRPLEFYFSPFTYSELWGSGLLFPQRDPLNPPLTRRVLVTSVLHIERPSLEFSGGREVVELSQGIPMRAMEYVGDLVVSETEFLRGRPQLQRLDLNFDGHFDTVRFFRREYRWMELEDLWNFDRDYDRTVLIE